MLSTFDEWPERLHRVSDDGGEIETFLLNLNQAVTDAREYPADCSHKRKSVCAWASIVSSSSAMAGSRFPCRSR